MGTYWKLVNITKREQFEPPNNKMAGFIASADQIMGLLLGNWRGDLVSLCADSEEGYLWDEVAANEAAWPNRYVELAEG